MNWYTKRIEILICTVSMIPLPFIRGGLISWPLVVSPTETSKMSSKSPKKIPAKQKGTYFLCHQVGIKTKKFKQTNNY